MLIRQQRKGVGICGPDGPGEEVTRRDSEVWASAPCSFQGQELGWKEGGQKP
jgi:hypothetical protein